MSAPTPFTIPELLFALISHIGRRRDLLSLALTSKEYYSTIVPSYLDLIHIRCDIRRIDIWQWLASAPHLAARVRTLELYREGFGPYYSRPIIPSPFQGYSKEDPGTEEVFVQSLTKALSLMTQLQRLRLSPGAILSRVICERLISLGQHFDMEESYFGFDGVINEPANLQVLSPLLNFDNITTFSLEIFYRPCWASESERTDPTWIMQLKNLNNLRLASTGSDYIVLSAICRRACWPRLVEFSLHGNFDYSFGPFQGIFNDEDYDAKSRFQFGNFIRCHPNLKRFELRQGNIDDDFSAFLIEPEIMSQLRSFIWSNGSARRFNESPPIVCPLDDWFPVDVTQPLQYLECSISAKSLPALRTMTFLRALYIVNMDLNVFEHLVEAVPDIQHLHIPCHDWFRTHGKTLEARQLQDRVVTSLFKLKHLVQLEGLIKPIGGYVYENIIKGLREHERLLYIDRFTWEQLDVIVKALVEDENRNGDSFRRKKYHLLRQLTVTVPNLRKSAGFYIDNFSAPLTI